MNRVQPSEEHKTWETLVKAIPYVTLMGILGVGLYLRTANLMTVQHFAGDQGRDYVEVMKWLQDGRWPLLGPWRQVGDFSIGPGWYYTLAPALGLSGFHPTAGAMTMAVFGVMTAFFSWLWIWRSTGSHAAGLAVATAICLASGWVERDRTLWNPHIIPCAVPLVAFLIWNLDQRPLSSLSLLLMLFAILPQWHTTGFFLILAALPCILAAAFRSRKTLRSSPLRLWLIWGLVLLTWLTFLYLPPILNELRPGPGNMRTYITKTSIPYRNPSTPILQQAMDATTRITYRTTHHLFRGTYAEKEIPRLVLAAGLALLFLMVYVRGDERRTDLSALYLAFLLGGYWLLMTDKGEGLENYLLFPVINVPLLLAGWTGGRLLNVEKARRLKGRIVSRAIGLLLLVLCLGLALWQLPLAWNIPRKGHTWHSKSFHATALIAGYIARDAEAKPYSVLLAEKGNFPAHFHYLLRKYGHAPINRDYYAMETRKEAFGDRLYVIVRSPFGQSHAASFLRAEGLSGPLPPGEEVQDANIYRIPAMLVPDSGRKVVLKPQAEGWVLSVQ